MILCVRKYQKRRVRVWYSASSFSVIRKKEQKGHRTLELNPVLAQDPEKLDRHMWLCGMRMSYLEWKVNVTIHNLFYHLASIECPRSPTLI